MARTKTEKGFDVTEEIVINVSAEKLWEIVGPGFEKAYLWASNVDHSVGSGNPEFEGATCSERSCDINASGFSKISEKLVKYSDEEMSLAYAILDGMPTFIISAVNDWKVVAIDETHCKLIMNAEFKLKGLMGSMMKGMMSKKMKKLLQTVLSDAKIYAETGQPSKIKQDRIEKLAKKNKVAA